MINVHERDLRVYWAGTKSAIEQVASGALDPSPLYTHVFLLEVSEDAIRLTRERPDGFLKALVRLDGSGQTSMHCKERHT